MLFVGENYFVLCMLSLLKSFSCVRTLFFTKSLKYRGVCYTWAEVMWKYFHLNEGLIIIKPGSYTLGKMKILLWLYRYICLVSLWF